MAFTAEQIAGHPALSRSVRRQSQLLVEAFEANPRTGAVFATQQRWLMAHVGLFQFFKSHSSDGHGGMHAARIVDMVAEHKVASRNTADAFLREMLAYNIIRYIGGQGDKRVRPMEPVPATLQGLNGWVMVHLNTLDSLDDRGRLGHYLSAPDSLARLHPEVALGLLTSPAVREPQRTFSLFTWLNKGGAVMDWLIAGIDPADTAAVRIPTGVMSVADMAVWLKLSRTHLTRKLREAEALGSLGWERERGRSRMWVSQGFYREYLVAQAVKLSIFDVAFDACFESETVAKTTQK